VGTPWPAKCQIEEVPRIRPAVGALARNRQSRASSLARGHRAGKSWAVPGVPAWGACQRRVKSRRRSFAHMLSTSANAAAQPFRSRSAKTANCSGMGSNRMNSYLRRADLGCALSVCSPPAHVKVGLGATGPTHASGQFFFFAPGFFAAGACACGFLAVSANWGRLVHHHLQFNLGQVSVFSRARTQENCGMVCDVKSSGSASSISPRISMRDPQGSWRPSLSWQTLVRTYVNEHGRFLNHSTSALPGRERDLPAVSLAKRHPAAPVWSFVTTAILSSVLTILRFRPRALETDVTALRRLACNDCACASLTMEPP